MLELNNIYKLWYREEPPLTLRPDLRTYLQENESKYFGRITEFEKQTQLKKN